MRISEKSWNQCLRVVSFSNPFRKGQREKNSNREEEGEKQLTGREKKVWEIKEMKGKKKKNKKKKRKQNFIKKKKQKKRKKQKEEEKKKK